MSVVAMKWAIEVRGISMRAKSVLMVLAWHANSKTQRCNPSLRTIADEAGMSRNTVDAALDDLHEAGLIESKQPKRRDAATKYTLRLDSDIFEDDCGSTVRPRRGKSGGSTSEPRRGSKQADSVAQLVSRRKGIEREAISREPATPSHSADSACEDGSEPAQRVTHPQFSERGGRDV